MKTVDFGSPSPLGASHLGNGWWNFAVYSAHPVSNLVLGDYRTGKPHSKIPLNTEQHVSGDIWHCSCYIEQDRFAWGWEICSPNTSCCTYAVDPYALFLRTGHQWGKNGWNEVKAKPDHLLGVAAISEPFTWHSHPPLQPNPLIIYESHVRGFTNDPSSHVQHPGTYLGMIEKLPHLKKLGITAIELLPIFEFDETSWKRTNPSSGGRLFDYWGYSPLSFFAPMQRYGTTADPLTTATELKTLVDACHAEGIAVILDVVYNHTGEGNNQGPAYSFKQLDEQAYYLFDDAGEFTNYSGCGNTLNANHPIVSELILSSLRHWVTEYHIDGFRFDLASALTRNQKGGPMSEPSLIEAIIRDPIVGKCLLIAEPWDAAGLYQTGLLYHLNQIQAPALMEWNDHFRDDVRRFIKGDSHTSGQFASRLCGSEDLYGPDGSPRQSINYITSHDGFCLTDLVSYHVKHNLANGEENQDGMNGNFSWNCGAEGPTKKLSIQHLRERQIKNFLVALFLSQGNPMLLLGDECYRSALGNNNTWCQDSPLSWINWDEMKKHEDLQTFITSLIRLRQTCDCFHLDRFLTNDDVQWHGQTANNPEWEPTSHLVALTLFDSSEKARLFIAFNASSDRQRVELPRYGDRPWHLVVNTFEKVQHNHLKPYIRHSIVMGPYSSVVFQASS